MIYEYDLVQSTNRSQALEEVRLMTKHGWRCVNHAVHVVLITAYYTFLMERDL